MMSKIILSISVFPVRTLTVGLYVRDTLLPVFVLRVSNIVLFVITVLVPMSPMRLNISTQLVYRSYKFPAWLLSTRLFSETKS